MRLFRDILSTIIDTVLPPKARTLRTEALREEDIVLTPQSHELLGATITTLTDYRNNMVRDLVQSLKYDGGGRAAELCARVLAEYLREVLSEETLFSQRRVCIAPIPLHPSRKRERGYNQIELVLERLPDELRNGPAAHLAPHTLLRTRATRPQTRLPRSERLSNVAGAFTVGDETDVKGTHVILVDDVTTTGATLVNAGNALRRAGAKVTLLALARA